MTCADIPRFTMKHFRYPIRWYWSGPEHRNLVLCANVPDRNSGKDLRVSVSRHDFWNRISDEELAFQVLMDFARHEADEAFHVDDIRFDDPHACDTASPHPLAGLPAVGASFRCPHDLHAFVNDFLPRVEVRHLRYPVRWRLSTPGITPVALSLFAEVGNRANGMFGETTLHRDVLPDTTSSGLAWAMLGLLRDFMVHEAAESFHVDGVRLLDPHKPSPAKDTTQ
jgi:hypothetical protein